jgi:clan AA aspartic protease (TIGR02281 family)
MMLKRRLKLAIPMLALASLVCASFPAPVNADSSFDEGLKLFSQGSYHKAADRFGESYGKVPTANTAYYVAVSLERSGDGQAALAVYQKIIREYPGTEASKLSMQALNNHVSAALANMQSKLAKVVGGGDMRRLGQPRSAAIPNDGLLGLGSGYGYGFGVPGSSVTAAAPTEQAKSNYDRRLQKRPADLDMLPDHATAAFNNERNEVAGNVVHRMIFDCKIDGHPVKMQLDTGAGSCVIGTTQLYNLGVPIPSNAKITSARGFGGSTSAYEMTATVTVGSLQRTVPLTVLPTYNDTPLIGYSFLIGYDYMVDSGSQHLTFIKERNFGTTAKAPPDPYSVPFELKGDKMIVMVEINGTSRPMIFDTGADTVTMPLSEAQAFGLEIPRSSSRGSVRGVGGSQSAYMFNVPKMSMGQLERTNVPIVVISSGPSVIGQSFLQRCNYTVDLSNNRLLLPRPN